MTGLFERVKRTPAWLRAVGRSDQIAAMLADLDPETRRQVLKAVGDAMIEQSKMRPPTEPLGDAS